MEKLPPIKLAGFPAPLEELCAGYDRDGIQALEAKAADFERIAKKRDEELDECRADLNTNANELAKARNELLACDRNRTRRRSMIEGLEKQLKEALASRDSYVTACDEARKDIAQLEVERDAAQLERNAARQDVERQKGELYRLYKRLDAWRGAAGHLSLADVAIGGPHMARLAALYNEGAGHA